MQWFAQNWVWVLFFVGFIAMHMGMADTVVMGGTAGAARKAARAKASSQ